jgi:malate dehydrogenase (oxaloacetate-decarboxylating)
MSASCGRSNMVNLNPTSSFSISMHLEVPNRSGMLASIAQGIASVGGNISSLDITEQTRSTSRIDITVDAASTEHGDRIVQVVKTIPEVRLTGTYDRTMQLHRGGKIRMESKISLDRQSDLAMAYTPGVGRVCLEIANHPERVYDLTIKGNTVAIVTDGSAVLGLGNLGAAAAMPVMEGKAMLFKEFAGIDAFPICLDTQDTEEIINTVKYLAPVFGGVNLEDIAAPRCFEIEARLRAELDIPVFHDDQHGTAIVTLAALINSLKLVKKSLDTVKIVINGAGAAGIAIAKLFQTAGVKHICICDSKGILSKHRTDLNSEKQEFAVELTGTLADAMVGADVFLGVSAPGVVTPEMVQSMALDPIVFAMANPIPEIQPELVSNDVAVMATGRSDYPNQINNVLAFPGVFRGAMDCRASKITTSMYLEAAKAIASLINPTELHREYIIPSVFDKRVSTAVASAVQKAAREEGIAKY